MSHAVSRRSHSQANGTQKWTDYRNFSIRKFFEQGTNKKSRKVHHDVKHADDDSCSSGSNIQIIKQITEK